MQEALDIYIKLIIAIISFIAPLLIHLLSVFSDGTAIKTRRFDEFKKKSELLMKEKINSAENDLAELVKEDTSAFEKRKDENNKQLALLDPKEQIRKIFPVFFYSLVLIIFNRLLSDSAVKDWIESWKDVATTITYQFLRGGVFIWSLYFAIKGVIVLQRVVWGIIDVKQEIAKEAEREKEQSKKQTVTLQTEPEKN